MVIARPLAMIAKTFDQLAMPTDPSPDLTLALRVFAAERDWEQF